MLKYKIDQETNRLTIHLNRRLSETLCQSFISPSDLDDDKKPMPSYLKDIFAVPGIETICVNQHAIVVVKGAAFEWTDEVISMILFAIHYEFSPAEPMLPCGTADVSSTSKPTDGPAITALYPSDHNLTVHLL